MRIVGFGQDDPKPEAKEQPRTIAISVPVRSLVSINFQRMSHALTYYNDQYDLKPGDRVFVTGKLEGEIGIVESVTTKFRIRISDYQRVISIAQTPISGSYVPKGDMMLSYDTDALSPDDYRKWILPTMENKGDPDEEIVFGDGYEVPLDDPTKAEGFDGTVFERAINYCRESRIGYISLHDGTGKAFVRGSHWYEIDFTIRDNMLAEAYCDCPFAGLCKHLLAVAVLLNAMMRYDDIDLTRDFTLIEADQFWNMVRHNRQRVTI